MSGSAGLEVADLSVGYRDRVALRKVSLALAPGELVALAGPNGSGKSTLLRAIVGLEPPLEGTVRLSGRPLAELDLAERARTIAWMPQEEPPGDDLRVADYVLYGRAPYRGPFERESASDREAARRALDLLGAGEFAQRPVWELSGGERQRVRIARVLAQSTPLVLLDEPTSHLDVGHQLAVLERLQRYSHEEGRSLVVALHDLNLAARFADRLLVLSRGRAVASGRPREVLSPTLLREVWGVEAELRRDPRSGIPYLLPTLPSPPTAAPGGARAGGPSVHVIAGGGSASGLLEALVDSGASVTVGPLHLLDSDLELSEALHLPTVVELPFAPVSPSTLEHCRELIRASDAVVLAGIPIGPGNVAILEMLLGLEAPRPSILLLAPPAGRRWDYTDGSASRLRTELVARGALELPEGADLLGHLRGMAPTERDRPP